MLTTQTILQNVKKIKEIEDMASLSSYVDFLLYKEIHNQQTKLGQEIIQGLTEVVEGKTYKIKTAEDILKVVE